MSNFNKNDATRATVVNDLEYQALLRHRNERDALRAHADKLAEALRNAEETFRSHDFIFSADECKAALADYDKGLLT